MKTYATHLGGSSVFLLLVISTIIAQSVTAQTNPGALDPTFADSGMSRLSFGGDYETCRAVAVQSDGKLLLAGGGDFGSGSQFELVRLGTNNVRDLSFGTAGAVLTPFFDEPIFADASAAAIAVQADGKIVAVGSADYDNGGSQYYDFAVARYNADGSLDNSFGSGGKVLTDLGGAASVGALVIQPDGKLVVAGTAGTSFALARYQTNGLLDTTFGTGGTVSTYAGGGIGTGATGLLRQPNGRLIAVGSGNGGNSFAVLCYTTNGVLDGTFGSGGIVYTTIPGAISSYAMCAAYERSFFISNPDKFVVGGGANNNSWSVSAVVRYNVDGTLDTTFGNGGIVTNSFASGAVSSTCTAILDVGVLGTGHKIIVGGQGSLPGVIYFGIARLLGSGAPDTTFGSSGSGMTALSFGVGRRDLANALTVQSGNYVLAGVSYADTNISNGNLAAARFTSGGLLDTSFGSGGVVTFDLAGQSYAQAVAVQPDGRVVAAGGAWVGPISFGLARYNRDGTPDVSFGSFGRVTVAVGAVASSANALQLQPDGRIVTAGFYDFTNFSGTLAGFALARHNSDGTLDASFGTGGVVTTTFGTSADSATGVALQSDGKIVAAGNTQVDSINHIYNIALARYTTNGQLDGSFGGSGKIVTQVASGQSYAGAVAIQPDAKIVVGGYGQVGAGTNFALLRFLSDGTLDTSFGSFGRVTTDFGSGNPALGNALALQADGKIILAGQVGMGGITAIAMARYTATGTLDSSFGTAGKVTTQVGIVYDTASAVAVMPNGKILVAGPSEQGNEYKYAVLRYLPDGSLDASFGGGGKVLVNFSDGSDAANALAIDEIGRAVVAGQADTLFGIARLASEPYLKITSISATNQGEMLIQGLGAPATNQTLLASPTAAPSSFSSLSLVTPDAGGFWGYVDTNAPAFDTRFYRLSLP